MYAFAYHRPSSVSDAVAALAAAPDAKLLAGGQTLLPTMKQRLAAPADIIDLGKLADLRGIRVEGDNLVIGAMSKHGDVADSADVLRLLPSLASLANRIGDPAVRNRGTIGGSIANYDPAADYPAACLALGATIVTNTRSIPAHDFFKGLFETALEEGEMITKVIFPATAHGRYEKFRNPASRYAVVGVFVAKAPDGVRVAVTGAGASGAFRATAFEEALSHDFSAKALEGHDISPDNLNSDIHADAAYRAHLIKVMTKRAVAAIG